VGKIALLPVALANQIAAGEVVERPASALKELVENALDAGATRCDVVIEGGGITLLRVKDNGSGMSPSDARLAVQRHATSKLQTFEQLSAIGSFGFRGEALPSIASVSRFALRTRTSDADAGVELLIDGGVEPTESACAMSVGSEVELRDLFYNVPARRKFLRASGTEAGHLTEVLEAAALARPDVSFTLERDGRRAREWLRVRTRGERVEQILGDEEVGHCTGERGPLSVEAFLGRPEKARAGGNGLRLLVNGRPIRDRAILHTIAQAYGSVLERGRYPRGVVYLDLPPELVDVNVHPQKSEVRFADGRATCDALYQILSAELGRAFSLPSPVRNRWAGNTLSGPPPTAGALPEPATPREPVAPLEATASREPLRNYAPASAPLFSNPTVTREQLAPAAPVPSFTRTTQPALDLRPARTLQPGRDSEPEAPALYFESNSKGAERRLPEGDDAIAWSTLRYVAQVRNTYLVCESHSGMYLLDQHAAAERVTYDRLKKQYDLNAASSQALLFPVVFDLSAAQVEALEGQLPQLERMGFEVQVRSETSASIHRVPRLVQAANPERLVRDLLAELSRTGREYSERVELALATLACHGSLRAGDAVSPEEGRALLRSLDDVTFAGHCPHGRPIVSFTPWAELERKVGRR
jgi:DNA mismatch repair protein MutL